MRITALVTLFSGSAIAASAALLACGNGDDTASPAPKVSDASADVTVVDGETPHEGGTATDAGTGDTGADAGTSTAELEHVYVIMMENHAYAQIIGDTTDAPNLNMLATKYGLAKDYYGVTHPSLPNYLAAISGDFQGIFDDCPAGAGVTCEVEEFVPNSGDGTMNQLMTAQQAANASMIPHWFSGSTIVDQLEAKGMTWAAYMGDIIATGDTTSGAPVVATEDGGTEDLNLYAQKHNPFMYFQSIRTNANRMQKIVPYSNFATDIAAATMPNYVWISPDQCSDMHGINGDTAAFADAGFCTGTAAGNDMSAPVIQYGDAFVGGLVTKIMAAPTWDDGSAIVVVFDEDDYVQTTGCCNSPTGVDGGTLGGALVPAIVISSLVKTPTVSTDPYNHYSMLATLQHIWGLDCLANTCGMTGTQLMTKLFLP
jgi:phosphatidylinositol-3-phosphatase